MLNDDEKYLPPTPEPCPTADNFPQERSKEGTHFRHDVSSNAPVVVMNNAASGYPTYISHPAPYGYVTPTSTPHHTHYNLPHQNSPHYHYPPQPQYAGHGNYLQQYHVCAPQNQFYPQHQTPYYHNYPYHSGSIGFNTPSPHPPVTPQWVRQPPINHPSTIRPKAWSAPCPTKAQNEFDIIYKYGTRRVKELAQTLQKVERVYRNIKDAKGNASACSTGKTCKSCKQPWNIFYCENYDSRTILRRLKTQSPLSETRTLIEFCNYALRNQHTHISREMVLGQTFNGRAALGLRLQLLQPDDDTVTTLLKYAYDLARNHPSKLKPLERKNVVDYLNILKAWNLTPIFDQSTVSKNQASNTQSSTCSESGPKSKRRRLDVNLAEIEEIATDGRVTFSNTTENLEQRAANWAADKRDKQDRPAQHAEITSDEASARSKSSPPQKTETPNSCPISRTSSNVQNGDDQKTKIQQPTTETVTVESLQNHAPAPEDDIAIDPCIKPRSFENICKQLHELYKEQVYCHYLQHSLYFKDTGGGLGHLLASGPLLEIFSTLFEHKQILDKNVILLPHQLDADAIRSCLGYIHGEAMERPNTGSIVGFSEGLLYFGLHHVGSTLFRDVTDPRTRKCIVNRTLNLPAPIFQTDKPNNVNELPGTN